MHLRRAALAALVLLASACAAAPQGGDPTRAPLSPRATLTCDHLAATQQPSLYEAIQRLQPSWLREPGGNPFKRDIGVFVNGARVSGGVEYLRTLTPTQVQEVRYLNGRELEGQMLPQQSLALGAAIMITTLQDRLRNP